MDTLTDLQPRIVEKMIDDNIVMIDVRREDEFKRTGVIRNSHLMTFFDDFGVKRFMVWRRIAWEATIVLTELI